MKGVFYMFKRPPKEYPIKKEPIDTVDTIYCDELNGIKTEDVLPYASPLPKYRREPEPPII